MPEYFLTPLHKGRPVLDVAVGVCDVLQQPGLKKADFVQPLTCRAIIDTTRQVTSVSGKVLRAIGLLPNAGRGKRSTPVEEAGYCVSFGLKTITGEKWVFKCLHVAGHEHGDLEFAVMIGVDLCRKLRIEISGPGRNLMIWR